MPDIRAEYLIIREGAGWLDRSARGRLEFEGADAAEFLQGLLTNDVSALGPDQGTYAALLTPQGRMIADFRVYRRDGAFVADVAPGLAAGLAERFDAMIFAEDVQVRDITSETAVVSVVGAGAARLTAGALGLDAGLVEKLGPLAELRAGDAFVARSDLTDVPMYDVWMPAGMRDDLVRRLKSAGAAEVSDALLDVLRVEAARPAFGIDMTTETIPLEAGLLDRAISTTKGCYVGQEVIIRVLHRGGGRVARRLVQIALDRADGNVSAGQVIRRADAAAADGSGRARDEERVTSAAFSPHAGRTLVLGYLSRELAEPGARVVVETPSGSVGGEVVRLAG